MKFDKKGLIIGAGVLVVIVVIIVAFFILPGKEDVKSDSQINTPQSSIGENSNYKGQYIPQNQDGEQTSKDGALAGEGLDIVYKTDSSSHPSWIPKDANANPWDGDLYIAKSSDGKTFTDNKLFIRHAGVPNLLFTKDAKTIATFQYFSYEKEDWFDIIAYTVSDDFGKTWSPVRKIKFDSALQKGASPVDPSLVQLDDGRYRLYVTFQQPGLPNPALFSTISEKIDGVFKNEGVQLSIDGMLLDPTVVFFKGRWHHYTPDHSKSGAIHSISDNGLDFSREENIDSDFQFLGGAIEDNGMLRFYGTQNGVVLAESDDGYSFTKVKENVVDGADPGIAKFSNGNYLIVYNKQSH